jgi:hypothetical protein
VAYVLRWNQRVAPGGPTFSPGRTSLAPPVDANAAGVATRGIAGAKSSAVPLFTGAVILASASGTTSHGLSWFAIDKLKKKNILALEADLARP